MRFTFADDYKSLSLEDRTCIVEAIEEQFTLKETESIAAYISNYITPSDTRNAKDESIESMIDSIYEKRLKVIHHLMRLKKPQLNELFQKLTNHSMPSKSEHAQCLVFPNCAYPALMNCMYCEYVLPQNLILIQLNQELLRLLTCIKENNNETFLKKQSHFLLQCLLILSEANNTFGKNHVKAYVNVKQINILLKQNAHKIYIPGVKDGD